MTSLKEQLVNRLPMTQGRYTVRLCKRGDLDRLADWPAYPFPYEGFVFSFAAMDSMERDALYRERDCDNGRITVVMDCARETAIGYLALVNIDWNQRVVGDMSLRLHPMWCDRGIGTLMLSCVSGWCFRSGIRALRLDVAASNRRAVRCYEKVGFRRIGELWREADDLRNADLNAPEYRFLREHVRTHCGSPVVRFWKMEFRNTSCPPPG